MTAKRRRPKKGVGARIRAFLEEEEALISAVATGNVLQNILVNGVSITDVLYKFGRNPILHEGELDPRLHFNDSGGLQIGAKSWNLPSGYIVGMSLAVLVAPENARERVDEGLVFTFFGDPFNVNELWGRRWSTDYCGSASKCLVCSELLVPNNALHQTGLALRARPSLASLGAGERGR